MEGDFAASFWQGQSFWFTRAIPTLVFCICFLTCLYLWQKGRWNKRIWLGLFLAMALLNILFINAGAYVGVELIRAGHVWALDMINASVKIIHYGLYLPAMILAVYNPSARAALPFLMIWTLPAVYGYSKWFVNLLIWYAQGWL